MTPSSNTQIALITGGSRGLGRNAAVHLARRGIDSIVTYRSQAGEAQAVVEEIQALGGRAAALQLDVGDSGAFPAFANQRSYCARPCLPASALIVAERPSSWIIMR